MIRLVICNQKGGVAKTTTSLCVARQMAENGMRVLLIDTDSQGSLATSLAVTFKESIYEFLINGERLEDCVSKIHPKIDLLPSSRKTIELEGILSSRIGREMTFVHALKPIEGAYDAILIDVAPSITLLQNCALLYAKRALIPLGLDLLSLQGSYAALQSIWSLNSMFETNIKAIGFLPVMVNKRLAMTQVILDSLANSQEGKADPVPTMAGIPVDTVVQKASLGRKFLMDYDSASKACQAYTVATEQIVEYFARESKVVA
jgi:chromosome partitioning protein